MNVLKCIVCGMQPESALPEGLSDVVNQPYKATTFSSGGHYGSTVFDPMDHTFLEVNVCDDCLVKAARNGRVLHGVATTRTERKYSEWRLDDARG